MGYPIGIRQRVEVWDAFESPLFANRTTVGDVDGGRVVSVACPRIADTDPWASSSQLLIRLKF